MREHVPSQSKNSSEGNTTSICQTMNNAMHVNHFKQHIIDFSYFETKHKESMNHWESIVNIALCCYKLVSNHKYKHMYKSINKKSSYRLSLLHPFRRSSSLLPCHLHDRTLEIIIITDSS